MVSQPILELQNINKSFGHVHANQNISLKINEGDIHGIIGENGAGKSTLMSIVYGFYQADSGNIKINSIGEILKLHYKILWSRLFWSYQKSIKLLAMFKPIKILL